MRKIAVIVSAVVVLSATGVAALEQVVYFGPAFVKIRVPACTEDETYLKGLGQYHNGRFARYRCVHPDRLP